MKKINLIKLFRIHYWLLIISAFGWYGCAEIVGIRESPLRVGYGFHADPGLQIEDSKMSAHILLAYSRFRFDGGGGHNRIWQFGGQLRYSLSRDPMTPGLWFGGETSYLAIAAIPDNGVKSTAPGFTIGGLAGYRFLLGRLPASIYFAPAFLSRGKFSGTTYGSGSSGFYGKLGLDLHIFSLLLKDGR